MEPFLLRTSQYYNEYLTNTATNTQRILNEYCYVYDSNLININRNAILKKYCDNLYTISWSRLIFYYQYIGNISSRFSSNYEANY